MNYKKRLSIAATVEHLLEFMSEYHERLKDFGPVPGKLRRHAFHVWLALRNHESRRDGWKAVS